MASDIIRKIEDLIEGIDEFNEKYVTYNTKVLRIVLVETIDYIKQKERALDEIKEIAEPFCNACQEFEPEKSKNCINCTYCNYNKILQKISEVLKDE